MEKEHRLPAAKKPANYISDKGLLFNIQNELLRPINTINNPVLKMHKILNRLLPKKKYEWQGNYKMVQHNMS